MRTDKGKCGQSGAAWLSHHSRRDGPRARWLLREALLDPNMQRGWITGGKEERSITRGGREQWEPESVLLRSDVFAMGQRTVSQAVWGRRIFIWVGNSLLNWMHFKWNKMWALVTEAFPPHAHPSSQGTEPCVYEISVHADRAKNEHVAVTFVLLCRL